MQELFHIRCTVSGGFTGSRSALLKGSDGEPKIFDSLDAAGAEAARLHQKMNSPHATASFTYLPEKAQ